MDDLLREAIADAKAVRETALENAKIALEEAFTPRLQSMLSKKIAAEVDDKDEEDKDEEMREADYSDKEGKVGSGDGHVEKIKEPFTEDAHDAEEEMDDSDEMRHEEMRGDKEEEMDDKDEMGHEADEHNEAMHDKEEEDSDEMRHEEMDKDEEDSDEMRHEEMDKDEEDSDEMRHEEMDKEEEDDLDLESVLAELEADLNEEDKEEDKHDAEEMRETATDASSEIGAGDNKLYEPQNDSSKIGAQGPEGEGSDEESGKELDDHEVVKEPFTEEMDKDKEEEMDEDIDLDEVLKALSEEDDKEEDAHKVEELQAELKETRNVVQFMRDKLNEVNLLNAKLLFSNKLFRAFGLNNTQKLKVVETFDRTKNLREVKLVYATLAESFNKPSIVKESVSKGSSSKPVRSTKPAKQEVLSEGQELKARFKKLANIL